MNTREQKILTVLTVLVISLLVIQIISLFVKSKPLTNIDDSSKIALERERLAIANERSAWEQIRSEYESQLAAEKQNDSLRVLEVNSLEESLIKLHAQVATNNRIDTFKHKDLVQAYKVFEP